MTRKAPFVYKQPLPPGHVGSYSVVIRYLSDCPLPDFGFNCGVFSTSHCPGVPIEARNVETSVSFHVDSEATRLYGLPAGDYELSISITGAGNFVQKRVTVTSDSPVRFDIIVPLG